MYLILTIYVIGVMIGTLSTVLIELESLMNEEKICFCRFANGIFVSCIPVLNFLIPVSNLMHIVKIYDQKS